MFFDGKLSGHVELLGWGQLHVVPCGLEDTPTSQRPVYVWVDAQPSHEVTPPDSQTVSPVDVRLVHTHVTKVPETTTEPFAELGGSKKVTRVGGAPRLLAYAGKEPM